MAAPRVADQAVVAHLVSRFIKGYNPMKPIKLSIIIPCLNEEKNITKTLSQLQGMRQRGHEIILSDGGSHDTTIQLSEPLVDKCVSSSTGRARQMNTGASHASGDILCFLHADTLGISDIDKNILSILTSQKKSHWGFFQIKLSSPYWPYRIIECCINGRSCISKIATGDQGIFIYKTVFEKLNGYSDMPLMEDIELSKRLKKISSPICIKHHKLITSSRRWEKHGILQTILLMWRLRFRYFMGTPSEVLAKEYNHARE